MASCALEAGARKADKICANTEARTLACRSANTGRHHIQDSENSRSHHAQSQNLIHRQAVTRNKERSHRNKETLDQILYHTVKYFGSRIHSSIFIHYFFLLRIFYLKEIRYTRVEMATEREDFLEEDAEITGQKFCLLSFLSPEKVLKDKAVFMFEKFLGTYEFQIRTNSLEKYLMDTMSGINAKLDAEADALDAKDLSGAADVCRKAKIRVDTTMDSFHEFVKGNQKELNYSKLKEQYDDFLYAAKTKLEDEFYAKNEFRTTVRGLKVRGVYASQAEATLRSKKLQRQDTLHNIFVGEVGKWLPWDPEPTEVGEQEYAEDQLNTLMKKYKENEEDRQMFQRERRVGAKPSSSVTTIEGGEETSAFNGMFGSEGPADLAMARKMAAVKDVSGQGQ
jgi:hypothetical protein